MREANVIAKPPLHHLRRRPTGKCIQVSLIDGSAAVNKALRTRLWNISQKPAVYPQLFACTSSEQACQDPTTYTFIGTGEQLLDLVELETIDATLAGLLRQ